MRQRACYVRSDKASDRSFRWLGPYSYGVAFRRLQRITEEPAPRRHGFLPFVKRWMIPIIGALTPLGLIVVNISVFIVKHLSEFRWSISILAFVSSLMLNSWAGLNVYRIVQRRRPDSALVKESNQELVLVGGLAVIIAAAFLTALFCYLGLSSEQGLPNVVTFLTGAIAFLVPILLQLMFRRGLRAKRPERTGTYVGGLPSQQRPPGSGVPQPPPLGDQRPR